MQLKAELLKSSSGSLYLGCHVMPFVVQPYQRILIEKIGTKKSSEMFVQRKRRDGISHHVTLVAPNEVSESLLHPLRNHVVDFEILGLGRAFEGQSEAAFIVLNSWKGAALRSSLGLPPRDFHITIGFVPKDIHHKHKNRQSLVYFSEHEKSLRKYDAIRERFDLDTGLL